MHLQNPSFCNCVKDIQSVKQSTQQHFQISFLKLSNLCRKFLNSLALFMFPRVKTQFSLNQKNVLVKETIWKLPNYEKLEFPKMTHANRHTRISQMKHVTLYCSFHVSMSRCDDFGPCLTKNLLKSCMFSQKILFCQ